MCLLFFCYSFIFSLVRVFLFFLLVYFFPINFTFQITISVFEFFIISSSLLKPFFLYFCFC